MNEIEKLYENAGIEPKKKCYYWDCPYSTGMPANDIPYTERNCQDCNNPDKAVYPLFTAEKQLEIVKFLLKKAVYYDVKDDKYWFYYEECESAGYKPFDEAIAHFINKLWQDLTEEEKVTDKRYFERIEE